MLSEIKMSGETLCLLLIELKHSTEQNGHLIKLWNLKWKGVHRDRPLKLLSSLNWTADVCYCLLFIYLKHSTEQNGHFIKIWNLKWIGVAGIEN